MKMTISPPILITGGTRLLGKKVGQLLDSKGISDSENKLNYRKDNRY